MMSRTRWLLVVFASVWVAACGESTGLPSPRSSVKQAQWSKPVAVRSLVMYQPAHPADAGNPARVSGPTPETGEVTFWVYQDRETLVVVRYQEQDGTWRPYAELVVPRDALLHRPDGSPFAANDSTLVTMTADSLELRVELEPSGLVFQAHSPARLTLWYTGANPDFDGNGMVDAVDAYIEEALLGLWVRVNPLDPWDLIVATRSLPERQFTAMLQHFSGYAVAY